MPPEPNITLPLPSDAAAPWANQVQEWTATAARLASERLGLPAPSAIRVVTFGNDFEFQRYLGFKPTHVVAIARAELGEIVIMRPALFALPTDEQQQTLVHELAHLIMGTNIRERRPAWLEEGLAQLTAREGGLTPVLRLTAAGTFNLLPRLADLEDSLLVGGESQSLAYAQALSVTRFLNRRYTTDDRDPRPLAQILASRGEGPRLIARLWEPAWRDALDWQWRREHRSLWTWLAALSGGGFLWGFSTLLFLLAYWRKRRMSQQLREQMGRDEALEAEFGPEPAFWDPPPAPLSPEPAHDEENPPRTP